MPITRRYPVSRAQAAFAAAPDGTCRVVCAATCGDEMALLAALLAAGCPAHRADIRKIWAFIRSFATLGKCDALGARALARYGAYRHASLLRWTARLFAGQEHGCPGGGSIAMSLGERE